MTLKRAYTHTKPHHADDVFATAVLQLLYPDMEIIRTRDSQILSAADPVSEIVYDVGSGKYDHHQNEKEYRDDIPYAAFGLIWRDYGKSLLKHKLQDQEQSFIEQLHLEIDRRFVQGIDGPDNGMKLSQDKRLSDVSDIIYGYNRDDESDPSGEKSFLKAVSAAKEMLENKVHENLLRLLGKQKVADAFAKRDQKEILVLPEWIPWEGHLLSLDSSEEVLFVIFPGSSGDYRIQVVPVAEGEFKARKSLPERWAGLNNDELGKIIGINDAIFCHSARFIAAAHSMDSVLKMAKVALN